MALLLMAALIAGAGLLAACGDGTSGDPGAPAPIADIPLTATALGDVALGGTPDDLVATLTPLLGGPSLDTGWIDGGNGIYGACPPELRVVAWGSLTTFHRGGPEAPEFFAYSYGFDFAEAQAGVDGRGLGLTTPSGIGIGSTVSSLQAAEPAVALNGDVEIDVWTFAIDPSAEPHLRGQLTGIEAEDTVLFIETSTGCS